jgi:hypothetical protein
MSGRLFALSLSLCAFLFVSVVNLSAAPGDRKIITHTITGAPDFLDALGLNVYSTRYHKADDAPNQNTGYLEFYECHMQSNNKNNPNPEPQDCRVFFENFMQNSFDFIECVDLDRDLTHIGATASSGGTYSLFGEVVHEDQFGHPTIFYVEGICPENDVPCLTSVGAYDDPGENTCDPGGDQCDGHNGQFPGMLGEEVEFAGTITSGITDFGSFAASSVAMTATIGGQQVQIPAAYFCNDGSTACGQNLGPALGTFVMQPCLTVGTGSGLSMGMGELTQGAKISGKATITYDDQGVYELFLTEAALDDTNPGDECANHNGQFPGMVGDDFTFTATVNNPKQVFSNLDAIWIEMETKLGNQAPRTVGMYLCLDGSTACATKLQPQLRVGHDCLLIGSGIGTALNVRNIAPGTNLEGKGRIVTDQSASGGIVEMFVHEMSEITPTPNDCSDESAAMTAAEKAEKKANQEIKPTENRLNAAIKRAKGMEKVKAGLERKLKNIKTKIARLDALHDKFSEACNAGKRKACKKLRKLDKKFPKLERNEKKFTDRIAKKQAEIDKVVAGPQAAYDAAVAAAHAATEAMRQAEVAYNQCMS